MQRARAFVLTLVLAALPLAGCFGAEETPLERTVSATGGKASAGWAYDGAGIESASAKLDGLVNNPDNTGSVTATFTYAGSEWAILFEQFAAAPDKAFMDGGVAFDLVEHGDSGVADASIPRIHAIVAAWGKATVTRDGAPVAGQSGATEWSAHLMVSDTTVRGADGKILKADGATPYDPASPADARRVEGDPQAILWVKSPDGENAARAPVPVTGSAAFLGPESTQTIEVPAEKGARVALNLTADGGGNPLAVGQVAFRLVDAAGTEVAAVGQQTVTPAAAYSGVLEVAEATGPLTLEITGQGVFTASVEGAVSYADVPFLVLTWDDVTVS